MFDREKEGEIMEVFQLQRKKGSSYALLKVWQIIELVLLFFLIPGTYGLAVLFTGDGNTVINFYKTYIFPFLIILFIVKIIVTGAFFKNRKWALYYNYIESIFLLFLSGVQIPVYIIAGLCTDKFSLFSIRGVLSFFPPVFLTVLFWFLTKKYDKIKNERYDNNRS